MFCNSTNLISNWKVPAVYFIIHDHSPKNKSLFRTMLKMNSQSQLTNKLNLKYKIPVEEGSVT